MIVVSLGRGSWLIDFSTDIGFRVPDVAIIAFAGLVLAAVPGIRRASGALSSESDIAFFAFTVMSDQFFMSTTFGIAT